MFKAKLSPCEHTLEFRESPAKKGDVVLCIRCDYDVRVVAEIVRGDAQGNYPPFPSTLSRASDKPWKVSCDDCPWARTFEYRFHAGKGARGHSDRHGHNLKFWRIDQPERWKTVEPRPVVIELLPNDPGF